MTRKQKALKALIILGVVIALCMFFARTVQTITTPKVQRISASKGKLEEKISLTGAIYFPQTKAYKIKDALKMSITVDEVMVRPGYQVQEGDVLFTAYAPDFESKMAELEQKYTDKVGELSAEYAAHIKQKQQSEHNVIYNALMEDMENYYLQLYRLTAAAALDGYSLPADESTFASITDAPENTQAALDSYLAALAQKEESAQKLRQLYQTGQNRVGDNTFQYVKKLDEYRSAIYDIQQEMLELEMLNHALSTITAPQDGYITAFDLKEGDIYDGSKTAFSMSAPDAEPALRADITSVSKTIREGSKAELSSGGECKVVSVENAADGKKYAVLSLSSKAIQSAGGMSRLIADPAIPLTLQYKAAKSATLLPASCVRTDGSETYVYIVERTYGGILDSSGYTIRKQTVTVLEKTDQIVSVAEDLSYIEIADREDRALTEGQAVMDYVD